MNIKTVLTVFLIIMIIWLGCSKYDKPNEQVISNVLFKFITAMNNKDVNEIEKHLDSSFKNRTKHLSILEASFKGYKAPPTHVECIEFERLLEDSASVKCICYTIRPDRQSKRYVILSFTLLRSNKQLWRIAEYTVSPGFEENRKTGGNAADL